MSELIIHGLRPTENFTIIPNEITQNRLLSFEALGFVTYLLGVPEFKLDGNPWETSIQRLCKLFPDSTQYKISKILGELKSKNFLSIERVRDGSNRKITKCRWSLFLDRMTGRSSLQHDNSDIEASDMTNQTHNKTDSNQTDLNQTNSVPESPPLEISEPISLDLEQSFSKPETTNRIQARIAALMHQSTSNANQERIKQREHEEARFAQLQRHNKMLDARQHLGITAPYAGLSPAQTVAQLCKEYIANPRPRLDEKSRKKLTAWLEQGGQLVCLIDCFKQAHQNQSKTAKYVVKILAT